MLKIRLARYGRKALPFYRIVLIDARRKREGKFLDQIGTYDPFSKDVKINIDLYKKYVSNGAQPTSIVGKLYKSFVESTNE